MFDSFFTPLEPDAGAWEATPACAGPWSAQHQHGGPPSALLVRQAELEVRATRDDLASYRVAVDFLGPVPLGPVEVRARTVRSGRSVVLVDSELSAAGRTCLHARTWLVRTGLALPTPVVTGDDDPVPGPDDAAEDMQWDFPYAQHMEWRPVLGGGFDPGPGRIWGRPRVPLVPAEVDPTPMSGLQRAALLGDSGSGVSSELRWQDWSFLNIDLDLHLLRQPRGDWLLLDARTRLGPDGTGLATSLLRDEDGAVGTGNQTLVISPRP